MPLKSLKDMPNRRENAEQAQLAEKTITAMNAHDKAIALAEENGSTQDIGMANELAGEFWLEVDKTAFASIHFQAAADNYTQWGAHRRAQELADKFPQCFSEDDKLEENNNSILEPAQDSIDFASILKSAQALSKELSIEQLLETLLSTVMDNTGALYGVLLLEKDKQLHIIADGTVGPEGFTFQRHKSPPHTPNKQLLSMQAVTHAYHTGKMLVLKDAQTVEQFTADPYISTKKPRSVLCLPVMHQSICIGVIYLENNLTSEAFTPERVRILELLSSQIAISLANAQYVADIKQETDFRKIAEKQLAEERTRLAITLGSICDGVIATDDTGKITLINQAAEEITGWHNNSALGHPLTEVFIIIDEYTRNPCPNPVAKVLETCQVVELSNHTVLVAKDRKERIIADSGAPIRNPSGQMVGVVLVFRDTTEKRQLENQLREAQKLEAIGTLSGGIAHDFNNILGGIVGCIDLMNASLPSDASEREWLDMASTACDRAKTLVLQLLDFCRPPKDQSQQVSLNLLLEEIVKLLRASIPPSIKIDLKISPKKLWVMANATRLHQVIMNLCTNASHAMREHGGQLKITLRQTQFCPDKLINQDTAPQGYAMIVVSDTGHGMTTSTMEKIFNPYFTTKKKEEGTGLGLAVTHGIIKSYNGAISVKSKPGKSSSFSVFLPLSTPDTYMEPVTGSPIIGGHEHILLVDDEPLLLAVGEKTLSNLGYTVKCTKDPINALAIITKAPMDFDLIITDMTMPKMTGDHLATEIHKVRPDLPIIICTGFSEKLTQSSLETIGAKAVIIKPFKVDELGNVVRSVLDS